MSKDFLKGRSELAGRDYNYGDEPARGRYSASKRVDESLDSNE